MPYELSASCPSSLRACRARSRLAYLDPPFNTQQAFLQYDDALEHSVWLTMMRDRLVQIRKLLAPDGSVWVHCDDSEEAYLRVLMDELSSGASFVATVVWQKRIRATTVPRSVPSTTTSLYTRRSATDWKDVRNRHPRARRRSTGTPNNDPGARGSIPLDAQGFREEPDVPDTAPTGVVQRRRRGAAGQRSSQSYKRLPAGELARRSLAFTVVSTAARTAAATRT